VQCFRSRQLFMVIRSHLLFVVWSCTAITVVATTSVWAQELASLNVSKIIEQARKLRRTGHGQTAIELIKRARRQAPDDERLAVFLAWTYWEQGNRLWALRTAAEFSNEHSQACSARATAVWAHLQLANLVQADELLSEPGCDQLPQDKARVALLRAMLAELRHDKRLAARYSDEAQASRLYVEDAPLLDPLLDKYQPGRMPLFASRLDIAAGWTSNGLAGSPVDLTNPVGDKGSSVLAIDGRVRAVLPAFPSVRPVITAQLKLFELFGAAARDLSFEQPTFRAGLLLGRSPPTVLISYALDAVRLHAGDRYDEGPVWFSEAHRLEWESEVSKDFMAFGGLGYRWFRDMARTRFEVEQGFASSWSVHPKLRLLGAMSARWQQAHSEVYDLIGGTSITELDWTLGSRVDLRWTLAASFDYYPRSLGFFPGSVSPRRDLLERSSLGLWYTIFQNWQVVPTYEFASRTSTSEPYSYVDHRFLGRVVWNFDTGQHSVVGREGRAPMEWSRKEGKRKVRDDSRIQELLRQDDAVRRGSSCLK
jgi:hypothetical protein